MTEQRTYGTLLLQKGPNLMKKVGRGHEPKPLVLSVSEAATMLRLGKVTMYKAVKAGTVPSIRVGRKIGIPIQWLQKKVGIPAA